MEVTEKSYSDEVVLHADQSGHIKYLNMSKLLLRGRNAEDPMSVMLYEFVCLIEEEAHKFNNISIYDAVENLLVDNREQEKSE